MPFIKYVPILCRKAILAIQGYFIGDKYGMLDKRLLFSNIILELFATIYFMWCVGSGIGNGLA